MAQQGIFRGALRLSVVAGALLLAWPTPAAAETSAGADELFREGVEAMRQRRYDDAISLFRLSYQMSPRAATMCNLALAYERSNRTRQAIDAYRTCAAVDNEGRYREHAQERARDLERESRPPRPEPRPPPPQPRPRYQPQPQPQPGYPPPQQQPQPQPERTRVMLGLGIAASVLGLGALGAAIGLDVWSAGVYDDLHAEYQSTDLQIPEGSSDADRLERGRAGVQAALGLYISGAVLTAAGVALIVADLILDYQHSRNAQRTRVALMPSRDGLSLALSFDFDLL